MLYAEKTMNGLSKLLHLIMYHVRINLKEKDQPSILLFWVWTGLRTPWNAALLSMIWGIPVIITWNMQVPACIISDEPSYSIPSADRIGEDLYEMSRRHTWQRRRPLLLSIKDITPTPSDLYEDVTSVTV